MFKPVVIRRIQSSDRKGHVRNKFLIDEQTNEEPQADIVGNQKFLYVKINKRAMKIIKIALQRELSKTLDPTVFDPNTDKDEIEEIQKVAEETRLAFDLV